MGKWKQIGSTIRCSECKGEPYWNSEEGYYPYCPYCGTRMENAETKEDKIIKQIKDLQKQLIDIRSATKTIIF